VSGLRAAGILLAVVGLLVAVNTGLLAFLASSDQAEEELFVGARQCGVRVAQVEALGRTGLPLLVSVTGGAACAVPDPLRIELAGVPEDLRQGVGQELTLQVAQTDRGEVYRVAYDRGPLFAPAVISVLTWLSVTGAVSATLGVVLAVRQPRAR
jgi:hypothetical protein